MPLPGVAQYIDLLVKRDPSTLFTLIDHEFLRQDNRFIFFEGTSAVAFQAEKDGQRYAVRFFLRGEEETFNRYEQIAQFFHQHTFDWVVPFDFLRNEVLIDGHFYPVVRMQWVSGTPLHLFIETNLNKPDALARMQQALVALQAGMEEEGISHGDLKYNNIIVQEQNGSLRLKLIDYDTIYIPAFEGRRSLEIGSPGFQPLRRLSSHFSPLMDRYSIWVMLATLEALRQQPAIWSEMDKGGFNNEHSLFSAADFLKPESSQVFQQMRGWKHILVDQYLDQLIDFSKVMDFSAIPPPRVLGQDPSAPLQPKAKPGLATRPVQVRTVPAGKDVLVNGQKKGITPLRLELLPTDQVAIRHEGETIVLPAGREVYELELQPAPWPPEPNEIVEFTADRYAVEEGGQAVLRWKVKGQGPIHISNMGQVEKSGSRKVALRQTTNYVLTAGSTNRSLTIEVEPRYRPQTTHAPAAPVPKTNASRRAQPSAAPESRNRIARIALPLAGLILAVYLVITLLPDARFTSAPASKAEPVAAAAPVAFNQTAARNFLDSLYLAYNQRNLQRITAFYAPKLSAYYESRNVTKDSLALLMKDLFIEPTVYQCTPNYQSLQFEAAPGGYKLIIELKEKLQAGRRDKAETYTSKIEYFVDSNYKIVSERHLG